MSDHGCQHLRTAISDLGHRICADCGIWCPTVSEWLGLTDLSEDETSPGTELTND